MKFTCAYNKHDFVRVRFVEGNNSASFELVTNHHRYACTLYYAQVAAFMIALEEMLKIDETGEVKKMDLIRPFGWSHTPIVTQFERENGGSLEFALKYTGELNHVLGSCISLTIIQAQTLLELLEVIEADMAG